MDIRILCIRKYSVFHFYGMVGFYFIVRRLESWLADWVLTLL